jgi:hypothetical protein
MRTPVLLLIYRRPELTEKLLAAVRQARPEVLLISADAPHPDRPGEARLCEETRAVLLDGIDWPCQVETRFAKQHLGCRRAVTEALAWAFEHHERLIILEDDCLPDASFFRWCDDLLEQYAQEERILHICGSNLAGCKAPDSMSGYFSRFGPIWGWATWRRSWQLYDVDIKGWPEIRDSGKLTQLCPEPFEAEWRKEVFDAVHSGGLDTWDYQWAYSRMVNNKVCVIPTVNLVQNIGFGDGSTHSDTASAHRLSISAHAMNFPLMMPQTVTAWQAADQAYLRKVVGLPFTLKGKIKYQLRKVRRYLMQGLRMSVGVARRSQSGGQFCGGVRGEYDPTRAEHTRPTAGPP